MTTFEKYGLTPKFYQMDYAVPSSPSGNMNIHKPALFAVLVTSDGHLVEISGQAYGAALSQKGAGYLYDDYLANPNPNAAIKASPVSTFDFSAVELKPFSSSHYVGKYTQHYTHAYSGKEALVNALLKRVTADLPQYAAHDPEVIDAIKKSIDKMIGK